MNSSLLHLFFDPTVLMPEETILENKSLWIILFIAWRHIFNSSGAHTFQSLFLKKTDFYLQLLNTALLLRDSLPSVVNRGHTHQTLADAIAKISPQEAWVSWVSQARVF